MNLNRFKLIPKDPNGSQRVKMKPNRTQMNLMDPKGSGLITMDADAS